jgi:hypothetical protein
MPTNDIHINTLKCEIPMNNIVACRGPLLRSDRETDNETSAARQYIFNK